MIEQAALGTLNHLLKLAHWAQARLQPFAGRRARFVMPPFDFAFQVDEAGLVKPVADPAPTDVTIHLPANSLFLLPQGLEKLMAEASVEGNAEFATELSFVFRHLRWDAEEDLSRVVGDIAAQRIVQGASRLIAWQQQAVGNLAGNIAEYLVHEHSLLIASQEFNELRDGIANLSADLTRLEVRSKALS